MNYLIIEIRQFLQEIRDETTDGVTSPVHLSRLAQIEHCLAGADADYKHALETIAELQLEAGTLRGALLEAKGDKFLAELLATID